MDKLLVILSSVIATIFFIIFLKNTNEKNSKKKDNNNKVENIVSESAEESIFQKSMRTTSETLSQLVNYINKPSDKIFLNKDIKFSIDIPSISTILIDKYGEKLAEMILKTYSQEEIENLLYD